MSYQITQFPDDFPTYQFKINAVKFIGQDEKYVTVAVKVNSKAMKYRAIQYLKYVTVLTPKSLVDDIKSTIAGALDNYNKA